MRVSSDVIDDSVPSLPVPKLRLPAKLGAAARNASFAISPTLTPPPFAALKSAACVTGLSNVLYPSDCTASIVSSVAVAM